MSSSSVHSDSQSKNPTSLYSRKEKSLGVLCSNFLRLYDRDDVDCIGLDHAADQLGVERRRIYDIVNILESVGLLSRRAKNQYTWKGFAAIPRTLDALKGEGLREKLSGQNIANVSRENEYRPPSNSSTKQDNTHELIKGGQQEGKIFGSSHTELYKAFSLF
nr:E2F transcription factor-like E2FF isoform X1 [Ipomoea batatas]